MDITLFLIYAIVIVFVATVLIDFCVWLLLGILDVVDACSPNSQPIHYFALLTDIEPAK